MSRVLGGEPERHGGKRPFRGDERTSTASGTGFGGWNRADVIVIVLLAAMLVLVSVALFSLLFGVACDCERW